MFNKKYISFMTACFLMTNHAHALEAPRIIIAPSCLLKNLSHVEDYQTLSSQNELSLIQIEKKNIVKLIAAKHEQITPCGGFKDVTSEWKKDLKNKKSLTLSHRSSQFLSAQFAQKPLSHTQRAEPYQIQYTNQTKSIIEKISPESLWQDLTTLSNFHNRNAQSDYGVEAVNWVKNQLTQAASNRKDVSFTLIPTEDYKQSSLVMKIGESNDPGIVIGAHIDTTTLWSFSSQNREPGADDDGSGSVTILQAAKVLLASDLTFKKPIYFIWYAAEEEGLLGSQEVVRKFKKDNIPVSEVIHFDMTGYTYHNEKTLWILDDNTNKELTSYLGKLITTYVNKEVKHTRCGYGCSDHASWNDSGFKASMATETSFKNMNTSIHGATDTMDKLSQEHITDFAKLAAAFAVELAEPIS
jgi:leucyl aminopeptidase